MAGRGVLRRALVAMVPQIDELQKNRKEQLELQKQASMAMRESEQEQQDLQQQAQEVASGSGSDGSGSSSQGRKIGSQNVQALVHAFHCTEPACHAQFAVNNAADLCATCAGTKLVLKRMEVHVQQCPTRRAQQSAQQGGPPPQQAECKMCKIWEALHRTQSSAGQQQSVQQRGGIQPSATGRGGPHFNSNLAAASFAAPGGSSNDGGLACATTPGMGGDVGGMASTFNPLVGSGLVGGWEGAGGHAVRKQPNSTDDVNDNSDDGIEIEEDEEVEVVDEVVRYARVKMTLKGH